MEKYRRCESQLVDCHSPAVAQTEQCCVFQESTYGGRFTLSASSCGSIKGLAEWIWGHLLWTMIPGAQLDSASVCNVLLDSIFTCSSHWRPTLPRTDMSAHTRLLLCKTCNSYMYGNLIINNKTSPEIYSPRSESSVILTTREEARDEGKKMPPSSHTGPLLMQNVPAWINTP